MILSKDSIVTITPDELVQQAINDDRLYEIMCFVPTNRRALQFEMDILQAAVTGAINPPVIETIHTVALALLRQLGDSNQIVSETAANLFLKQCMEENPEWRYFKNYRDMIPDGLVRILRQLFAEWKRQGVAPESVIDQISPDSLEYERLKVSEVAQLYAAFCNKLSQTGRMEHGDVLLALLSNPKAIALSFNELYPRVKSIIITGYSELSESEALFVSTLADIPGMTVLIEIDYNAENLVLFQHTAPTINKLQSKGFKEVRVKKPDVHPLKQLYRSHLFTSRKNARKAYYRETFTLHRAASAEDEVRQIALSIRRLIREEGVNAGDIAVVFQLIQEFTPHIRSVFSVQGIRFNLTDRPVLSASPVVIAVINLCKVLESDFYYKDVLRAFAGPYISPVDCSLADITAVSMKYRVISGLREWLSLENRIADPDAELQSEVKILQACTASIKRLQKVLKPLSGKLAPDRFYQRFREVVENIFYPTRLPNNVIRQKAEEATALTAMLQSVKEICDLLSSEPGKNIEHGIAYYLEALQASLSNARYTLPADVADTVLVTTPEEIRGMQFRHVFIGGMYDGNFPTRYVPDIFSPKTLSRDDKQYIAQQQYLFYEALLTAERVHFSYPGTIEDKVLNPSHFLTSFIKQFDVTEITSRHEVITAPEELLKQYRNVSTATTGREMLENTLLIPVTEIEDNITSDSLRIEGARDGNRYAGSGLADSVDESTRERLLSYADREYSITQLEMYAACPFRYFLERIMGVKELKEPEEEAGRMEFGTLLHDILFEFVHELLQKGILLAASDSDTLTACKNRLFELAQNKVEQTDIGQVLSDWDKELILGINGNRDASILGKFIQYETQQNMFAPVLLETAFGNLNAAALSSSGYAFNQPIVVNKVKLRGKIDRIDINHEAQTINVVDYKTGSKSYPSADLEAGLILQLPVYLHAAKELLASFNNEFSEYRALYPIIYSLKYSESKFGMKAIAGNLKKFSPEDPSEQIVKSEAIVENALQAISRYIKGITGGKFNLTTLQGNKRIQYACGYCDFLSVCRFNETDTVFTDEAESGPDDATEPASHP